MGTFLRKSAAVAALFGLVFGLSGTTRAELPPGSYDKLRKGAKEVLIIEIKTIKPKVGATSTEYTVEANVRSVETSDTKLTKRSTITIVYTVHKPPYAGPRQVPDLEKGGLYPAFLEKVDGNYVPAAHGMSFSIASE